MSSPSKSALWRIALTVPAKASEVVADALSLPYDMVEVARPDTDDVPNSGPTVASRTCMVVGKLVQTASHALRATLEVECGLDRLNYTPEEFSQAIKDFVAKNGKLRRYAEYEQPANIEWSDETYVGDAYGAYGWAIYVADHLPDEERRQHRILNILSRNCPRLSDRTTSEINAEQEYMHRVQFLMQEIGKYSKRRRSNVVCNYR